MGAGSAELRRRERQQALVADLGRSAVTGTPLPELLEKAVAAVADGLGADRVALFEPTGDDALAVRASLDWPAEEASIPVDADSPVAQVFRAEEPAAIAGWIAAPVRGQERLLGVIAAAGERSFSPDDVIFLRGVANLVAASIARDRTEALRRRSEEALTFLADAGHVLAQSLDYEVTLATLADLVVPRLADWFIVDVAQEDGAMRRVAVRASDPVKQGYLEILHRDYQPVVGSGQPAGQALAHGGTVHFQGFTPETLRETTLDDRHFELMSKLDPRSAVAVALVARGRILGALTFAWSESGHRYTEADVTLAEELAGRAALAIDNSRLYRTTEQAQRRFGFLVEASDVLASSLDYDETLSTLARLAVPRLGDWCVIYIVDDDGAIERRAVEHAGGRQEFVRAILDAHAIIPDATHGVPHVIRTGRSELSPDASPLSVASDAEDPQRLADALGEIEVRSTMCVPLIARRRTLGAILFVSAESGRRFDEDDLRLAEELAARAAVAVDNSRLFYEAEHRAEAARALDSIADGVFLVDARGAIRIWNAAAELITGLGAPQVRGRGAADVFGG
ncbi:MAG: GAF domain-containing protein [Gaiellaceae bacterium]